MTVYTQMLLIPDNINNEPLVGQPDYDHALSFGKWSKNIDALQIFLTSQMVFGIIKFLSLTPSATDAVNHE